MGLPGAILAPSALTEGDRVQARCRDGFWYNAKVIKKAGRGASVTATVNYVGFPATHDERFTKAMAGLRQPLSKGDLKLERKEKELELEAARYGGSTLGLRSDGLWEIERVLKKSGRRYLIRWMGWSSEHDSFVPRKELTREMSHVRAISDIVKKKLILAVCVSAPE